MGAGWAGAARLIALADVLDGMGRGAAAQAAGVDRQTLRDRVIRFTAEGVGGLRNQAHRCGFRSTSPF